MTTIREQFHLSDVAVHKITGLANTKTDLVVKSSEVIGIEVEIENVRDLSSNPNRMWNVIDDGSLRNSGREFVSKPIPASASPAALTYLYKEYLPKNCCYSPRTSVHVHLNMLDFTMAQVHDYVILYSLFEKLFYRFTGRGRAKNIYCVPLYDTDLMVALTEKRMDGHAWTKYTGLNLLPLMSYGTIEFRHMHGTNDVEKLCVWINLITQLKEYVRVHTTKDIRSDVAAMDDNYAFSELLSSIFGDYAAYLKYEGIQDVTYLPAKQALASRQNANRIAQNATRDSDFFKFKEQ